MNLVIISGLSGSGKSIALNTLEDEEYYCVDNLPVGLLPSFAEQFLHQDQPALVATSIDARNLPDQILQIPDILDRLRAMGFTLRIVFLDAHTDILIKRFSETRRRHPLTRDNLTLREAIQKERELLGPLVVRADLRADTSQLNIYQLRDLIRERIVGVSTEALSILFQSFGFKHGVPMDTDLVFDVRCLPNPYWVPGLRSLTGNDEEVVAFLEQDPQVDSMFEHIRDFLDAWIPAYQAGNRSYLTVSLGCTGGHHRSVYLVSRLAEHFRRHRGNIHIRHRELP